MTLTDMIRQGYGIDDMLAGHHFIAVSDTALELFRSGEIDFEFAQFISKGLRRRRQSAARELLKNLEVIEMQIQEMEQAG